MRRAAFWRFWKLSIKYGNKHGNKGSYDVKHSHLHKVIDGEPVSLKRRPLRFGDHATRLAAEFLALHHTEAEGGLYERGYLAMAARVLKPMIDKYVCDPFVVTEDYREGIRDAQRDGIKGHEQIGR